MDLGKIPIMSAITQKLAWLSAKQRVIAQNVANASTPGYRARMVEEPDFSSLINDGGKDSPRGLRPIHMKLTNSKHMDETGSNLGKVVSNREVEEDSVDGSPSGNTVVLEEQMMDMANTQIEYATMINLYRRHVSLLRTSLGKSR